jgi:hypothetical protein
MLRGNCTGHQRTGFVFTSGGHREAILIDPEGLDLDEIDPVLGSIRYALPRIELKLWYGIKSIPFLRGFQEETPGVGSYGWSLDAGGNSEGNWRGGFSPGIVGDVSREYATV